MLTIGVTGGIASGKSTVARLLAARGARVVDADRLVHETYAPGTPGYEAVLDAFGSSIVGPDGLIDRRALGRLVFVDPAQMARLTAIVWPLARQRVEALMQEARADGAKAFVVEAVALRQAGWADLFDAVWLVRAPGAAVRERLAQRGLTPAEAEARLAAQPDTDAADVVIDNDADLEALEAKVESAWRAVLQRPR